MRRAALLAVAAALSGCGGGDGDGPNVRGGDHLPGSTRAGAGGLSQASTATCAQYNRGSLEQRLSAVEQLGRVFERQGATLPARQAVQILNQACAGAHASNFKLYKLYSRALAFQGG